MSGLEELRRYKGLFDNAWVLATMLAAILATVCWYFRLAQVNFGAILWCLATVSLTQFGLLSRSRHPVSPARLRRTVLGSQLTGTLLLGVTWHLFGGLQQPLFPLLIALPLLPGALVLGVWRQQVAVAALLIVLGSGVLLYPDTNSFIQERYGLSAVSIRLLPGWVPRSSTAFADVSTSPAYEIVVTLTVAMIACSMSAVGHAIARLCEQHARRVPSLESDVARLQQLTTELVTRAPLAVASVLSSNGRIVNISQRFAEAFEPPEAPGAFLLDAISFAYPAVIKRLIQSGGEEVQGATVGGRDVVLRVRAEVLGTGAEQMAILNIECCDEICWRGAVDSLDEPAFVVNSRGHVMFLNRSAVAAFGTDAEGGEAATLFDGGAARWWDIAPLEYSRRVVQRGGCSYLASIKRERIAPSLGEFSFIHLSERDRAHVSAAS